MRFTFTPEQDKWRLEVRDFLTKEAPKEKCFDDIINDTPESDEWWEFSKDFTRKLGKKGWISMAWPKEHGGTGATPMKVAIMNEELAYWRAPVAYGAVGVAMEVMVHGTPEQKKKFLPPTAAGELTSSLYLSEPEAGSDLANLKTRAVRQGDYFVVNGQKIFSSLAHRTDYGRLIARTDPNVPKHRGLTRFIVDRKNTKGITIQAQWNISGRGHRQNIVFFDDVKVPVTDMIGHENQAWIEMNQDAQLNLGGGGAGGPRRTFDDFVEFCKTTHRNGQPISADPVVRHTLTELAVELEVIRMLYWQMISEAEKRGGQARERGGGIHPVTGAITTLMTKEWMPRFASAATRIVGPMGTIREGSKGALWNGLTERYYRGHAFDNHRHGTPEILRSLILGLRALSLPRGPRPMPASAGKQPQRPEE